MTARTEVKCKSTQNAMKAHFLTQVQRKGYLYSSSFYLWKENKSNME